MDNTSAFADTAFLSAAPIYSPLPAAVLRKLLERGSLRHLRDGEILFSPGDATEEAFVVKAGVVEICRNDPETGLPTVVAYLGEGDSVGEMVLFTGSPRSSLARVPEEADIFAISRAGMIELCREEPDLALYFCRLFASRLESWVKKGRRQDVQRQLQGSLRYFDLATVLQTLGNTERTGTLTITNETGQLFAELDFEDGRLQHARLGHLRGEQAFYQLFQPAPNGSFLFLGDARIKDEAGAVLSQNVMGLLMEAMRLQDEWQLVRERFDDNDRIYLPAAGDLTWEDDATFVAAFDVWTFLHRAAPLGQLLAELPYSTSTILNVLDGLLKTRQVK